MIFTSKPLHILCILMCIVLLTLNNFHISPLVPSRDVAKEIVPAVEEPATNDEVIFLITNNCF